VRAHPAGRRIELERVRGENAVGQIRFRVDEEPLDTREPTVRFGDPQAD
jgi:hypothetical protein